MCSRSFLTTCPSESQTWMTVTLVWKYSTAFARNTPTDFNLPSVGPVGPAQFMMQSGWCFVEVTVDSSGKKKLGTSTSAGIHLENVHSLGRTVLDLWRLSMRMSTRQVVDDCHAQVVDASHAPVLEKSFTQIPSSHTASFFLYVVFDRSQRRVNVSKHESWCDDIGKARQVEQRTTALLQRWLFFPDLSFGCKKDINNSGVVFGEFGFTQGRQVVHFKVGET